MEPQSYGTTADYIVIVVYMVAIFGFGAVLARYNRSTKDFFMGGQRFGAWVIALSFVATLVGSYSFVKYSAVAYQHGIAASMSYLNDWFWMPLFMFVWLPIIYYGRIQSVPEYFERRFDRKARAMATLILLLYMVGYIGINLLTMGKVAAQLLGYDLTMGPVFVAALIIAVVCAAYVTSGGQAAVILSDVAQGVLLLLAGLFLFAAGLHHIGGFEALWGGLSPVQRLPLAPWNDPPKFNFIGIFWQDAVTNGMAVYFLNQGMMLRFMSGRSVDTGRKALVAVLLVLQILAVVAVANAGWIGRALVNRGEIDPNARPDAVFMIVAHLLTNPGVFGFVLAALTAALMSTADTLINASASVWVNDVWRLYVRPDADDKHHLKVARWASVGAAAVGIAMVPIYMQVETIYQAHGAFTAAIGPPMAVALMLGLLWKRFTPAAAFWTMLLGLIVILISLPFPELVRPFAMGVEMDTNPWKAYSFQRALFGLVVCTVIGVVVSLFTKPREATTLVGMIIGTLQQARQRFKGLPRVNEEAGPKLHLALAVVERDDEQVIEDEVAGRLVRPVAFATDALMKQLEAEPGDLVSIADTRIFIRDLRGAQAMLLSAQGLDLDDRTLGVTRALLQDSQLSPEREASVQRTL